jgi:valyl-tRNA synthetase
MSAKHEEEPQQLTDTVAPNAASDERLLAASGDADRSVRAPSDLDTFLPTDVLVTGRDIIFLWVSRMIMLTKKFTGKNPFQDVVVTGTVLAKDGKPMSKGRGNGVDPIEMFDKFGVDATRIYLASIATGADIKWNDSGIEAYRNFANKIWNATRFCLMNSDGALVRTDLTAETP